MAFKPGRRDSEDFDFDKLRTVLNQTNTSQKNNPLYQFCDSLLRALTATRDKLQAQIDALSNPNASPSGTSALDFVVCSDGALPTPSPVDDGFGNFIYVPYSDS